MKRCGRREEDFKKHTGGVWKIAHADFMTAMMAFFLIMWLVNATDEEMKRSIANYFNPINLMTAPTDRRGLMDPSEDLSTPATGDTAGQTTGSRPMGADAPGDAGNAAGGGNVEEGNENRMDSMGILEEVMGAEFNDPFAVLASAAADLAPEVPTAVDVPQSTQGAQGHTAMTEDVRDPFDPAYWQTASPRPARTLRPGPADAADVLPPDAVIDAGDRRPTEPPEPSSATSADLAEEGTDPLVAVGPRSSAAEAVLAALGEPATVGDRSSSRAADAAGEASSGEGAEGVEETAAAIREALADIAAGVEVAVEEEGGAQRLLISLTDERAFSMFAIGSAAPTEDAKTLFGRVAGVLGARDGEIVVRGHTDARPFRGGRSDNWILSFARAHATKEALVGHGIPESRIARVEGLADRELSDPDDPLADENRRIEILYDPAGAAR